MDLPKDSLERRILEFLQEHYPITVAGLARELHLSEKNAHHTLKVMERRGHVELDILPDKIFVRPLVLLGEKGHGPKMEDKKRKSAGNENEKKERGGVDDPANR